MYKILLISILSAMVSISAQGKEQATEAYTYALAAAEKGDLTAQYILGMMYLNGEDVKQNDKQAFKWLKKAAMRGDADSQRMLALMYLKGQGVKQDTIKFIKWNVKAADQGDSRAQGALGVFFAAPTVIGFPTDRELAKHYLTLSCENGLQDSCYYLKKYGL